MNERYCPLYYMEAQRVIIILLVCIWIKTEIRSLRFVSSDTCLHIDDYGTLSKTIDMVLYMI